MVTKNYQHIDLTYLDLMTDGDLETRDTLLDLLMEELETAPAQMREAFLLADWGTVMSIAHKMKSSLAFVGNPVLINSNLALWEGLSLGTASEHLSMHLETIAKLAPLAAAELLKEKKSR